MLTWQLFLGPLFCSSLASTPLQKIFFYFCVKAGEEAAEEEGAIGAERFESGERRNREILRAGKEVEEPLVHSLPTHNFCGSLCF